jgi:A/G-specific adenine glycosylase
MHDFNIQLHQWYLVNQRQLPWRQTTDPYNIWISETILQQTQVKQGLNYYLRFIEAFPNVHTLASAPIDKVLLLWQGLGYYSRARNLHTAAQEIVENYQGQFPSTYRDIIRLKGIGPYTAAAITSIAFDLPHAVVDGNVYRFLARLFAIDTPIDTTAGKTQFAQLAHQLLDTQQPGIHNQAMMEFGAMACSPANPQCTTCPFANRCKAYLSNATMEFPQKIKKTKQRHRYFYYLLIENETIIWLQKRNNNDIWKGLYQLPLIETNHKTSAGMLLQHPYFHKHIKQEEVSLKKLHSYKHILSHQVIHAVFYKVCATHLALFSERTSDLFSIDKKQLNTFPFSKLTIRFLEDQRLI